METTEQMVKQTKQVVSQLQTQAEDAARRLIEQVEQVLPLVERVIAQTRHSRPGEQKGPIKREGA